MSALIPAAAGVPRSRTPNPHVGTRGPKAHECPACWSCRVQIAHQPPVVILRCIRHGHEADWGDPACADWADE